MSNSKNNIIVQKFGGATLADPEKIKTIARRVNELRKTGKKIVVIVSAMGQTTNQLIQLAHQVSARPPLREFDMLLSVGERISMSLVSMALNDLGCPAISFTGSQAGIITDDLHINANIKEIRGFRVKDALSEGKVVILAGFQGVSDITKEITTLGRGGSDITAVALAGFLDADRCEILKDVDSVYTADPRIVSSAKPIRQLNYDQLLEMTLWGAKVLNYRSVKMAAEKNVRLYVGPAHDDQLKNESAGTFISHEVSNHSANFPLAINSYAEVFELKLNKNFSSFSEFQSFLHSSQVGEIQLLKNLNESVFVSAPAEILSALKEFSKTEKKFSIANADLASVSLTYTTEASGTELAVTEKLLADNNFKLHTAFNSRLSLHFIVNAADRTEIVKLLHARCH